jgi:hypothetical protein
MLATHGTNTLTRRFSKSPNLNLNLFISHTNQSSFPPLSIMSPDSFISRWSAASASERSNSQLFLSELADLLNVERPHNDFDQGYGFEFTVAEHLTDSKILERLVALNVQRAREEAAGQIRWLRPDYQIPLFQKSKSGGAKVPLSPDLISRDGTPSTTRSTRAKTSTTAPNSKLKTQNQKLAKRPWPKSLPDRAKAIETILHSTSAPITPDQIAQHFRKPRYDHLPEIEEILETLCTFGRAHPGKQKGTYTR